MSRIGKNPVSIPQGVDVNVNENIITVKGKLGELTQSISDGITVNIDDATITLDRASESKNHKAQHGLMRALVSNMVEGVSNGFERELDLVGVGYRVQQKGKGITLNVMLSHTVDIDPEEGISLEVDGNNKIKIFN